MNSKQKILAKVRSLPAMASTATKMSKLMEDPNVNISEVVDTIKYDPGLTANVLKMANSDYFGFSNSINSVRHAIVLMGIKQVHRSIDALKEFLNIFCGQMLTTVYGEEPVFDLSVPEVKEINKDGWEELLDFPDAIAMMVEDVPLIAHASL